MKKLLIMFISLFIIGTTAFAENTPQEMYPNLVNLPSNIDLTPFCSEGFSCSYDDMRCTAEIKTPYQYEWDATDFWISQFFDGAKFKISFDIKMVYSSLTGATYVPRLLVYTENDEELFNLQELLVKVGNERYVIKLNRTSYSSSSYLSYESCVNPLGSLGMEMLKNIADSNGNEVKIRIESKLADETITLPDDFVSDISNFYNQCMASGIGESSLIVNYSEDISKI